MSSKVTVAKGLLARLSYIIIVIVIFYSALYFYEAVLTEFLSQPTDPGLNAMKESGKIEAYGIAIVYIVIHLLVWRKLAMSKLWKCISLLDLRLY